MSVYSVLNSLDEEAAGYVERPSGDLRVEVAERLVLAVSLLVEGRVSHVDLGVLWPQWWFVCVGFAEGYGLAGLARLLRQVVVLAGDEPGELADADLLFLGRPRSALRAYVAHRLSGDPRRFGRWPPGDPTGMVAALVRCRRPSNSARPLPR